MVGRLLPPARYLTLLWVSLLFVATNGITRVGLTIFEADWTNLTTWRIVSILAVGLLYDISAATFLLIPFAVIASVCTSGPQGRKLHGVLACLLIALLIFAVLFTAVAEALFWNEFSARFNFIAVDYLIYTRETLGNIRQSYPVGPLIAALIATTGLIFWLIRNPLWQAATNDAGTWRQRHLISLCILLLPVLTFLCVGDAPRESLTTAGMRELAGNGYYEFARAFRSNDIDFHAFYQTIPERDAVLEMRDEFAEAKSTAVFTDGRHPLERSIVAAGEARGLNVILVTMESLGADFVESLGGRKGLTPNLDRLGREGMLFTRMYATGTRTVRGLEALALSIPPTPGHAVLTRKDNKGFQTIGGVLKQQGYTPLFIYGGYSYFDNMKDFFGGNGYTVVDRTSLASSEISHETIWGVADEDLFKMVVREVDTASKPVFAHVMTTSNHRPFSYPKGRIDIPPGSSREGAVKYSDWSIGAFMQQAAARPWFNNTIFVFVADHTSHARGRTDLPPENYHIPMIIYAPSMIQPRAVGSIASMIDVGPTILALLNVSYTSQFFGQDILTEGQHHQRALMANYLTVGHMEDGIMVELSPKQRARVYEAISGQLLSVSDPRTRSSIVETIAHYQVATNVLRRR